VSLIKIDCEGFEWGVLAGCREIIAAYRPLLFVELHPGLIGAFGHSLAEVCDVLRPAYELQFWDANPSQRSKSRLTRYFGRYRHEMVRLHDEAHMLAAATREPRPDQLFLLALPR
jgi:hypothetical protein